MGSAILPTLGELHGALDGRGMSGRGLGIEAWAQIPMSSALCGLCGSPFSLSLLGQRAGEHC